MSAKTRYRRQVERQYNPPQRNLKTPEPGLPHKPKRKIVRRYTQGATRYAYLECGHTVRCPKSVDYLGSDALHCGECP